MVTISFLDRTYRLSEPKNSHCIINSGGFPNHPFLVTLSTELPFAGPAVAEPCPMAVLRPLRTFGARQVSGSFTVGSCHCWGGILRQWTLVGSAYFNHSICQIQSHFRGVTLVVRSLSSPCRCLLYLDRLTTCLPRVPAKQGRLQKAFVPWR